MAAARTTRNLNDVQRKDLAATRDAGSVQKKREHAELVAEHLPPLWLVSLILICSGVLMLFSLRDFLTTGKNIGGEMDEKLLVCNARISPLFNTLCILILISIFLGFPYILTLDR